MKRGFVLAAVALAAWAQPGAAIEKVRISATRKTALQREGSTQQLPETTTRTTREEVFYRIGLQRMTPAVPEQVEVEWVLVVERAGGRLVPAGHGTSELSLPLGREAELDTEPVALLGREWGGGADSVEDDIHGYAVRVRDANGSIVAEKFQPKSLEQEIEPIIAEWKRARAVAPRVPVRLPRRLR